MNCLRIRTGRLPIAVSRACLAATAFVTLGASPAAPPAPIGPGKTDATAGTTQWIQTSAGRLKAMIFGHPRAGARPVLIIVLHGDAPFSKPGYQYAFAQSAAGLGDVVAAAILRPGYTDSVGDTSSGARGLTTGDNYTSDRIEMIVSAIGALQREFRPRATVLVGHSGGAAIAADILGLHPGLAQGALLASCPCDVPAWRAHMKSVHPTPLWDQPIQSLSPVDLAARVSPKVQVRMVVGADDDTAPPYLTRAYADRLIKRGVPVQVTLLPGKDHEILLDPAVRGELEALLERLHA